MVTGEENDGRLDGELGSQRQKRCCDQPQCAALAVVSGVRQFPEHDRAGTDFDEGVEPETGEGDRARLHGREGEDRDADDVPAQGSDLEEPPSPQKYLPARGGWRGHGADPSSNDAADACGRC